MAHLHPVGDYAPRAWWQEVQLSFVQVPQSPEWFEWRKAILDELELLGSIGRSLSMINDDPRPTYDWNFYVWYNGGTRPSCDRATLFAILTSTRFPRSSGDFRVPLLLFSTGGLFAMSLVPGGGPVALLSGGAVLFLALRFAL